MSSSCRNLISCTVLFTAILATAPGEAAELGVSGKKLLLQSKPKMLVLSKDALVTAGANGSSADPRCAPEGGGLGGSIELDDGTNTVTLSMPCANWSTNGAGNLYKYKDTAGIPKVAKVKAGLLKVVSPAGMGGFPVPNAPATVAVQVQVGTDKYCMSFSGTGDGSKFLVKDAAAATCPPSIGTATPTATPTSTPTPTGTPMLATYAANVQPILQAKCAPCHTTLGSGGANLASSYASTQLASYYCPGQTKGACALVRVQDGSMPPGGGCTGNPALDSGNPSCLTAAEQNVLANWIAQGQLP